MSEELKKRWMDLKQQNQASETETPGYIKTPPSNENESERIQPELKPVSTQFGIETKHPIPSLKLIFKNARTIYIPYSHQPIIDFIPEKGVFIKTLQMSVLLKGQRLSKLADWLGAQKVTWIEESHSRHDFEKNDIFLEEIQVLD